MESSILYNNFFDRYAKLQNSHISDVVILLKKFQEYLDSIYLVSWQLRNKVITSKIDFTKVIQTLQKYMNISNRYIF